MSARLVADRLPALVGKVRSEGYPVIWLCDPVHGNEVDQNIRRVGAGCAQTYAASSSRQREQ
ncbi:3-deoxy-7-phosphoheptulonate synthase [Streptomyces sp. NPDC057199]|uniref:3-deoxy-7-phosphoheptulonate synthase n=1 Tax=Streptomyces sp. NPDC057199 TaxID=3346047 RepID=UPI0036419530